MVDPVPFHPDLRWAARGLPRGVGKPWLVWLLRRMPMPTPRPPAGVEVRVHALEGRGAAAVRVIGAPRDRRPRPALLWIHGGGYVIGQASQDDWLCARFSQALDAVIVSVDYRLAPEHPFPTPVEDCFAAYEWLLREAPALGVDSRRVAIGGASAGGGLAAALALMLHDRRRPAPRLQLLVYPMLDDRTVLRAVDDRHHRLWNPASNRFGWSQYLGKAPGAPDVTDHAAPGRRVDCRGLPPAWIGVGTLDLFHDEDVAYAERLRAAGVPVETEVVPGAFHGFDQVLPTADVSRRFFETQVAALRSALSTT